MKEFIYRYLIKKRKGDNEIDSKNFLNSLSDVDRKNVEGVVLFIEKINLINSLTDQNVKVGIIAVGSSVKPEKYRTHRVGDIDLKVLNSADLGSWKRKNVVARLRVEMERNLKINHQFISYENTEYLKRRFTLLDGMQEEKAYDDEDPCFKTLPLPTEGLPLHVCISGIKKPEMRMHILTERKEGKFFSPLFIPE